MQQKLSTFSNLEHEVHSVAYNCQIRQKFSVIFPLVFFKPYKQVRITIETSKLSSVSETNEQWYTIERKILALPFNWCK